MNTAQQKIFMIAAPTLMAGTLGLMAYMWVLTSGAEERHAKNLALRESRLAAERTALAERYRPEIEKLLFPSSAKAPASFSLTAIPNEGKTALTFRVGIDTHHYPASFDFKKLHSQHDVIIAFDLPYAKQKATVPPKKEDFTAVRLNVHDTFKNIPGIKQSAYAKDLGILSEAAIDTWVRQYPEYRNYPFRGLVPAP